MRTVIPSLASVLVLDSSVVSDIVYWHVRGGSEQPEPPDDYLTRIARTEIAHALDRTPLPVTDGLERRIQPPAMAPPRG